MSSPRPSQFGVVFGRFLIEFGVSKYKISSYSNIGEPYLGRLQSNERQNPSWLTVIKIGFAFVHYSAEFQMEHVNELLHAAGFAPLIGRGENPYR